MKNYVDILFQPNLAHRLAFPQESKAKGDIFSPRHPLVSNVVAKRPFRQQVMSCIRIFLRGLVERGGSRYILVTKLFGRVAEIKASESVDNELVSSEDIKMVCAKNRQRVLNMRKSLNLPAIVGAAVVGIGAFHELKPTGSFYSLKKYFIIQK